MQTIVKPRLFLIPNVLNDENSADFIANEVRLKVHHVKRFIIEQEKSARALVKKLAIATPQSEIMLRLWNEHSTKEDLKFAVELFSGGDVGLITDAGIPCVADPGADIVAWAHKNHIQVVPLPGASSILMALMGSGFNGQSFTFHGYLPIDKAKRAQKIKEICNDYLKKNQSQIFMEAPYRNNQLLGDIIKNADKSIRLCIARSIGSTEEMIMTKTLAQWALELPELHKKPAIFIIG